MRQVYQRGFFRRFFGSGPGCEVCARILGCLWVSKEQAWQLLKGIPLVDRTDGDMARRHGAGSTWGVFVVDAVLVQNVVSNLLENHRVRYNIVEKRRCRHFVVFKTRGISLPGRSLAFSSFICSRPSLHIAHSSRGCERSAPCQWW